MAGIRFAPLNVPRKRRLQTAAVFLWGSLLPIALFFFFILWTIPPLWPLLIGYVIWLRFDKAPERGGRKFNIARRWALFRWFKDYFPISMIKEADLSADQNYIFGYHPHGIISMGALANFGSEATGFSKEFPGINCRLLTLTSNFGIPFYRDYLLAIGMASVSRKSCEHILRLGPGNSIAIVIGGAAESLHAFPGTNDLTLKRRLGFIKLAIRTGSCLVPCFSFGENDIFDQVNNTQGTYLHKFQKKFQKMFGWTTPLVLGRGIFNYDVGFMPHRKPITSVVGRPITVQQQMQPTQEYVQQVQQEYIDELFRVWNKYKDELAKDRVKELTLVD